MLIMQGLTTKHRLFEVERATYPAKGEQNIGYCAVCLLEACIPALRSLRDPAPWAAPKCSLLRIC